MDKVKSEHMEQAIFVQWFRRSYPDVLIFAIPNGGHRSPSTALKLKVEGVVPGIPDLFVPEWQLWIEMKKEKGGVVSKEQQSVINYLERVNYCVIVGKGADDARRKVSEFTNKRGML